MKIKTPLIHILAQFNDEQRDMIFLSPIVQPGTKDQGKVNLRVYSGPGVFIPSAEFKSVSLSLDTNKTCGSILCWRRERHT